MLSVCWFPYQSDLHRLASQCGSTSSAVIDSSPAPPRRGCPAFRPCNRLSFVREVRRLFPKTVSPHRTPQCHPANLTSICLASIVSTNLKLIPSFFGKSVPASHFEAPPDVADFGPSSLHTPRQRHIYALERVRGHCTYLVLPGLALYSSSRSSDLSSISSDFSGSFADSSV